MAKTTHLKVGIILLSFQLVMLVNLCVGDIEKDKAECTNQLIGLSTCLPYVSAGKSTPKSPTPECCTGIKQVLRDSKKCLCILVKDRDDRSLGLNINVTSALSLPALCHQPDAHVSDCIDLLHLTPNSPEAKVYSDFDKAVAAASTTTPSSSTGKSSGGGGGGGGTTIAKETSDVSSAKGKKWLVAQMFCGVLLWCSVSHLVLFF